jgi:hypothetical protein
MSITSTVLPERFAVLAAALLLAACSSAAGGPPARTPSPLTGGLTTGLIAYVSDQGVGVLDPSSGKSMIVAPLPPGAFRVAGPVWAAQPKLDHPVLFFTIHDDRPVETRNTSGVQPYDWLFRVDPFLGTIEPIAASQDSASEGPFGLVANSHYVALTVGCCTTYEVDALDLAQTTESLVTLKTLAKPPAQPAFFTEGIVPGDSGLIAVRQFGTGSWYWLNADANVLNPFPLSLGQDDGPVAISADGTMAAVAMPDHGAMIEAINSALPVETPNTSPVVSHTPVPTASQTQGPPRSVNSKLPHPDGLAWSPDAAHLALAVNGEIEIYGAHSPDGTAPVNRYLSGTNAIGVSWSGAIERETFAAVKPTPGPQAIVDGLLAATKLPATADTASNRPFTKVYVWQFDSTRTSPIATIGDATPDILARYPPLGAGVTLHHWSASDTWALLGGCYRYRVVVTGSIPPVASTVGLATNALCSEKGPSPSPRPSPS